MARTLAECSTETVRRLAASQSSRSSRIAATSAGLLPWASASVLLSLGLTKEGAFPPYSGVRSLRSSAARGSHDSHLVLSCRSAKPRFSAIVSPLSSAMFSYQCTSDLWWLISTAVSTRAFTALLALMSAKRATPSMHWSTTRSTMAWAHICP